MICWNNLENTLKVGLQLKKHHFKFLEKLTNKGNSKSFRQFSYKRTFFLGPLRLELL